MSKRYEFDGFGFGALGETQLEITVLKEHAGYTTRFCIELTKEERKELILWLKTIDMKEKN
jgi:hypothetical protein